MGTDKNKDLPGALTPDQITKCPPGYAEGYSPGSTFSSPIESQFTYLAAMRRATGGLWGRK